MADAVVERRPASRFFCHRCNIEFEDVLQDYICPFCASGFIEQLESEAEGSVVSGENGSEEELSIDDSEETQEAQQINSQAVLNDLAFLMAGRRISRDNPEREGARREGLLEQLVWSIGGGGAGGGAITAGAPLVLVGAPGDYVFGGEGLDAVVTQLLGQLENSGPAPLSRDQIASIARVEVTPEQCAADAACSVCWDSFTQGEQVSKLDCDHIFHPACIEPWLRLHATCPICRRSLQSGDAPEDPPAVPTQQSTPNAANNTNDNTQGQNRMPRLGNMSRTIIRGLRPRIQLLSELQLPPFTIPVSTPSSASVSSAPSVTSGGIWTPRSSNSTNTSDSSMSVTSNEVDRTSSYNMDLDFD